MVCPLGGGVKELRDRIKLFATMWNAEVDSIHPRNQSQLVSELNQRENAHQNEKFQSFRNGSSSHEVRLKTLNASIDHNNGAAGKRLSSGNETFDVTFNAGFDALVKEGRRRMSHIKNRIDSLEDNQQGNMPSELSCLESSATVEKLSYRDKDSDQQDCGKEPGKNSLKLDVARGNPFPKLSVAGTTNSAGLEEDDNSVIVLTDKESKVAVTSTKADTMNKENNVSLSPPFSDVNGASVSIPAPKSDQCSHRSATNSSAEESSLSRTSSNPQPTPSSKRPSPTSKDTAATRVASSASKQRRVPWECPKCTFVNDGSVLGYCTVCRTVRCRQVK